METPLHTPERGYDGNVRTARVAGTRSRRSADSRRAGAWDGEPLWRTVWGFLRKWNRLLPYDPASVLFQVYSKELKVQVHTTKLHTDACS